MTKRPLSMLPLLLGLSLWLSPAAGAGSPLSNDASPLAVCQDTIRTAGVRLGTEARRVLSACLTAGIECVAGEAAREAACCDRAAGRCRGRLVKLEKAARRFTTYVTNRRCAVVPFADVLAEDGLGYEALAARCGGLEPRGTVDGLSALADCLARLVVAETGCALATELPRSADALACMGIIDVVDFLGCPAEPVGTPVPTATAAPLPSVTSTPVSTSMPTGTATPLPPPSATSVPTSAPATTRTATPLPTTTAVPTAVHTVTAVATTTATRTPTPVPTTTPTGPVCGNGVVETGELCDDGNTENCDDCPKNCQANTAPVACGATTVRHAQRVRMVAPAGAVLSGGRICIDYPTGVVALPGTGAVAGRASNLSGLVTLNDYDNAVLLTFVASTNNPEVNPTISFDLCTGQTAPVPSAFQCVVTGASNQGTAMDPASVVCTPVTIP